MIFIQWRFSGNMLCGARIISMERKKAPAGWWRGPLGVIAPEFSVQLNGERDQFFAEAV